MSVWFGQRLRKAREREGLTQVALATKLGVSQGAVTNWEAGSEPSSENRTKLEKVLGPLKKTNKLVSAVMSDDISSFGYWLREQRTAQGLSVPELSKKSKVSTPAIYNIESGRILNPQVSTRDKLASALQTSIPEQVVTDTIEGQDISGLGSLTDFEPHDAKNWPMASGVYVLYDVSQRPIYVGKAEKISVRLKAHQEKFWFKSPIVEYGSYIQVGDKTLRHQLEQALIRFLKTNAVINRQSTDAFEANAGD